MKEYQILKGRKVFREVLRKGRRYYEGEIQLVVYRLTGKEDFFYNSDNTPNLNILKVGIQIQKKFGNAVKRNHAKRQIRVIFRELPGGVKNNFYIIIRPLENFKKLSFIDSKKKIEMALGKAGVLSF